MVLAVLYASASSPVPSAATITAVRRKPVIRDASVPMAMIALERSRPEAPAFSRGGASGGTSVVLVAAAPVTAGSPGPGTAGPGPSIPGPTVPGAGVPCPDHPDP